MPRFKVHGADPETGEEFTKTVSAESAEDAEDIIQERGILVSRVEPIGPPAVQQQSDITQPRSHRTQSGHDPQSPTINVNMPKRSSSLGIVALILGVVALPLSFIPILGLLSIPIAGLGVAMAGIAFIIALTRSGTGIGWPIGGGLVAALALFVGIVQIAVIGGTASVINQAAEEAAAERERLAQEWEPPEGFSKDQISFTVTESRIEQVPLSGAGFQDDGRSENELFVVWLRVENTHDARRLVVDDLQGDFALSERASLEDEAGNAYARVSFGIHEPTYEHGRFTVDPKASETVALIFEKPTEQAKSFTLSVPAERFDGEGTMNVHFER